MEEQLSDRLGSAGRLRPAGLGRLHPQDGRKQQEEEDDDDGEKQTAGWPEAKLRYNK